ncbi:MAG: LacI family transcriptional regulator [Sediminibacterium sp.]|nr:LacI family transcriptional regulator [Sediminibacterium sp.]
MSHEKEITIYDIARELDISAATVSRGLKDHPAVNKATRKKIQDLAKQLGYRSNMFASNLRKKSTNTIGVIVPRLSSYFMSNVIAGMEHIASMEGYNLIISQSLETLKKEMTNADTMFNSRVDGLLVSLSYETENIDHFEPFIRKGIPVIFFDRIKEHNKCMGIIIDNYKSAYEATKHLLDNGYRRILHIGGSTVSNVYAERLRGYKQALTDHKIIPDPKLILTKNMSEEAGIESAKYILKLKHLPDAVFSANDACAVYCMRTLKKAGIRIPEDMAFVGFNNDPMSNVVEPNLTTVNYPGYAMGEAAVTQLINHLNKVSNITTTNIIILRSELIIRESSGKKKVKS